MSPAVPGTSWLPSGESSSEVSPLTRYSIEGDAVPAAACGTPKVPSGSARNQMALPVAGSIRAAALEVTTMRAPWVHAELADLIALLLQVLRERPTG